MILGKAEVMKLIFMALRRLVGFYRVGLIVDRNFVKTLSIHHDASLAIYVSQC